MIQHTAREREQMYVTLLLLCDKVQVYRTFIHF